MLFMSLTNGIKPTKKGVHPSSNPLLLRSAVALGRRTPTGLFCSLLLVLALPAKGDDLADPSNSYSIEVPVVSAEPVISRRAYSRPERVCEPVEPSRTRRSNHYYSDSYRYRSNDRYGHDRSRRRGRGAEVLGGILGGVIGNQFGKGGGRKALTIAGAVIGSSVAGARADRHHRRDSRRSYQGDYERDYVCRTTHREQVIEEITGYIVTYEYNGQLLSRRMDVDPGEFLELQVTATPQVQFQPQLQPQSPTPHSARRTL